MKDTIIDIVIILGVAFGPPWLIASCSLFDDTDITDDEARCGLIEWSRATGVSVQQHTCRRFTWSSHCDVHVIYPDGRSAVLPVNCMVGSGKPGNRWRRCEIAR